MAAKIRTQYRCQECGYQTPKWLGKCPKCHEWGTLQEEVAAKKESVAATYTNTTTLVPHQSAQPITNIDAAQSQVTSTGIGELDRVLGSGIIPGSVILLAGEPGVGKSTLLLEVAHQWVQHTTPDAATARKVLYVTAEESAGQVRLRAQRTGALHDNLYLASEAHLDVVAHHITSIQPDLVIIDSIQTMLAPDTEGVAGGVAQSRAATAFCTKIAKSTGIPFLLVGHVTKDGNVAGPRVLEHLVDVVLHFEGDRHSQLRMLRGIKNRFGPTDEVGCFAQEADGIHEVPDPSGLFLSHHGKTPDGTAVTVMMDGVRPLLTEVQALVVPTDSKNPRRTVTGLDGNRVPMILAVLQARARKRTQDKEVYVATVGGMRVQEPAADLAVALAVASALSRQPLAEGTVALGEVGLAGEIRPVANTARRLAEAQRLGYQRAYIAASPSNRQSIKDLTAGLRKDLTAGLRKDLPFEVIPVATIQAALAQALPSHDAH